MNTPTVQSCMSLIRAANPRMRRNHATAIVRNGSLRTVYDCICGESHSCATLYRGAKHIVEWRRKHNAECPVAMVREKLKIGA